MVSFYLALIRLGRATTYAGRDPEFRGLCATMILLLLSGTIFYVQVEGWSVVDALYFCVMTMATVGYGDLAPGSDFAKIFTIIYSLLSIGVFVAVVSKLAASVIVKRRQIGSDMDGSRQR